MQCSCGRWESRAQRKRLGTVAYIWWSARVLRQAWVVYHQFAVDRAMLRVTHVIGLNRWYSFQKGKGIKKWRAEVKRRNLLQLATIMWRQGQTGFFQ